MSGALALSRAIDALTTFVGKAAAWLILGSVLVSAINALVRAFLNISSNSWLELQWYLFGAAFMLAAAYTLKQNEHIRIDIIYGQFSRARQHWIDLLGHILFLMPFCLLMTYYFMIYVNTAFQSGEQSANAGGLLIWPGKLMLLLGFILLVLQGISEIIKKIAVMRGIIPDPTPHVATHVPIDEAPPAAEIPGARND
jgi:TRAP-type mannitol/chloroaromatic compound transport system permease small subunit